VPQKESGCVFATYFHEFFVVSAIKALIGSVCTFANSMPREVVNRNLEGSTGVEHDYISCPNSHSVSGGLESTNVRGWQFPSRPNSRPTGNSGQDHTDIFCRKLYAGCNLFHASATILLEVLRYRAKKTNKTKLLEKGAENDKDRIQNSGRFCADSYGSGRPGTCRSGRWRSPSWWSRPEV
jgi:hypothetical protein